MEAFIFVWVAGIVDKVVALFSFVGFYIIVLTFGTYTIRYFNWADSYREPDVEKKPPFKFHAKLILLGFVFAVVAAILPSERTLYLAGAAWMGQKVVQSETSDKVVKILNSKLDEYLKEAEEKINKVKEK